jgi:hypothetical protein
MSLCTIGSRNAAVFPLPVIAEASRSRPSSAGGIAVDATYVYWAADLLGAIRRRPKAGGPIETLADGLAGPQRVAVDATHVYWGEFEYPTSGNPFPRTGEGRLSRRPLNCGCDR